MSCLTIQNLDKKKLIRSFIIKNNLHISQYDARDWCKYCGYGRIDVAKAAKALRPVALRAHKGQYVCAEGGGGGKVVANHDWIRS